ncbi:GntR family transcriptional regulator [Tessaracoccus coleopterorum]|uniref:GntR family transcriptional regulator n=1 Tax=Tessaracoccus coleopterorum TaxID=2714950 RepID=UPI0038CD5589
MDELYAIRGAAERLAGELAIASATVDWGRAEAHLDAMGRCAEVGDYDGFAEVDLEFHTEFFVNSGNSRLLGLWRQYQPTFATLLGITNAQDADLHPSYRDHLQLIDRARAGDREGLAAALADHLDGSHRRLSRTVAARSARRASAQLSSTVAWVVGASGAVGGVPPTCSALEPAR